MSSRVLLFAAALFAALSPWAKPARAAEADRPNVVLILTDNQAAWTLGCYGNPDIQTPNIDRIARQGMLFSRAFSVNAVCSPTRASLLTGLIPSQHGVHCYLRAGGAQIGPDAYYTLEEFRTLPEILSQSGYVCGLSGKWHLGDNLHAHDGFRDWITMPHGATSTFYDAQVIEDGQIRTEPEYLTDLWTDHAVEFIRCNKSRPFFLYLPYNGPYGLGRSLLKPARNRHAEYYADKTLDSFPREPMHPWLFNNKDYLNNIQAIRRYAAEISGVDDGVGRVLDTLHELGLEKNTLVIFTGDQGLACGQHGLWAMGDHTRPLHTFDPGVHVPLIYRQPGKIPAGGKCDLMTSTYDIMPTVLGYLGLKDQMAAEPESPGRDYSAALVGKKLDWDNVVFYEFENTRMIRTADWKYTRRIPDGPDELYDLAHDPGERDNLAGRPEHAEKQNQLRRRLDAFFNHYADPKFDLWHGGGSKSRQLLHPEIAAWRPERQSADWQVLFDGKSLAAFEPLGCEVEIQDGAILLKSGNGLLQTKRQFGDFVLALDWKALKPETYDSGIYFRYQEVQPSRPWPKRYQVNLRQGLEGAMPGLPATETTGLVRPGEWNHFQLTVEGAEAAMEINGKPAWKIDSLEGQRGFIAIQAEVPKGGQFLFRNIRIRELNNPAQ